MHTYTSASQEELALGSLWSSEVIWYTLEVEANPQSLNGVRFSSSPDRPWLWFAWLPQHKKDAFLILTHKEKKHHYYYCCLHVDRLALRILKSQELQASWYESEDLESNESSSITWYIQPWVQRTRNPNFSPSSVCGNASYKLYAPISCSPLSSFSQEWEWRKMKVVTVIWMSSCHIPCAIKDLEQ